MSVKWNHWLAATAITLSVGGHAVAAEKVTVFAAASLTNALQDIASQYEKGKTVKIVSSFASSSTLARQRICLSLPTSSGWIMRLRRKPLMMAAG